MFNEFLDYLGDDSKPSKPQKKSAPRKVPVPAKPLPPVSKTFVVTAGGLLTSAPVSAIVPASNEQHIPPAVPSSLELFPYSDRSFAIFGDTRAVKDQLIDLGGSFNRFLKKNGVVTPGFIFSNKRLASVRCALNL